jgi:glycine/D-amino acid oxidase-like deaminating enzyme
MLGSTYGYGQTDTMWREAEHVEVCDKLARVLPEDAERLRELASPVGWVGIRAAPQQGEVCSNVAPAGLYYSYCHGSHGIASAAAAGEVISQLIGRRGR